jgi:hypothetical protein
MRKMKKQTPLDQVGGVRFRPDGVELLSEAEADILIDRAIRDAMAEAFRPDQRRVVN